MVDYRKLSSNTAPLTAAVPNIAVLIATIQKQAHPIMATIDVKDMFFMVLLQPEDQEKFAFTFTRLLQGCKHSPSLAHHAFAQELETISIEGVKIYQYIDDILIGGREVEPVQTTQTNTISPLEGLRLKISPEKMQSPSNEVKFLGIRWKGGTACIPIPSETPSMLDQVKMPESKKYLQHVYYSETTHNTQRSFQSYSICFTWNTSS